MILQTQRDLEQACLALAQNPYVTIDTEFLRDKTYYSQLCLIQMAGPGIDPVAIDPIGTDLDLAPVWELMRNEDVVKVFHAARQDMEIFFFETGTLPNPIFDTQVAAMVCGYGDQIAYSGLVKQVTGQDLEKTAQFTDWSRRPLSDKQLHYALNDVTYLREVYESLNEKIISMNRQKWVLEEMEILTSDSTYDLNPEEMWKRIKIRSDKPEVLAVLKELAAWREKRAQDSNVPRTRILKDDALADLALYNPNSIDSLSRIRALPPDYKKGDKAKTLMELIQKGRATPKEGRPKKPHKAPLTTEQQAILEMLKLLLKINAGEHNVTARLIANKDDLEALATSNDGDIPPLKGWRYDVFGKEALAMKSGKLALGLENDIIKKLALP